MSDKIVFYHNPMSRGRAVHWLLEEIGAPYEIKIVDMKRGEHKQPEFLAVNPMGKVPAIVHRGVTITETAAILTYLADAFPQAQLAPKLDSPLRGSYLRWMFFAAGCIDAALIDKMLNRPAAASAPLSYGSLDATLSVLETALTPGPFLLGDSFTAADLLISGQLGWSMQAKAVEPRPAFQAYVARCVQRPAYQRASADDDKKLAELSASAPRENQGPTAEPRPDASA